MSDIAIRVENLSKEYRIGGKQAVNRTFRETLLDSFSSPIRWMRGERKPIETFWALNDISFEIKQGEAVGIIGRNGAGKSTLLKVLSRITKPTKGRVDLYGRVASLLEVGTGFHSELSGRDNIYLNGAILGMSRREIGGKFDEIVDFSGVEKFLDTPVKHYSSGMYVRLAFAVAAHLEPEILVVDEVLAVGDAEFQKKCLGKMGDVAKQGRTVLFVSHNMNAIEQLCKSCIHINHGRLINFSSDIHSVIVDYLFGDPSEKSSTIWINSENSYISKIFKPISLALTDESGNLLPSTIPNNSDFYVAIEGELAFKDPAFTVGYAIYSEDGALLYWTYNIDTTEDLWPLLNEGKFKIRSKIPHRFLNEGVHKIEMIASLHFREWLLEPGHNNPSVLLTIHGGLSDSPLWFIRRPGLLAPVLKWENW
ncbi:MAG: ABC transporter ATP-binding protein [Chloroflexi bacterium]|nr:ABC transporter ATP-binding protein [Chloroflexota bacterium]